VTVTTIGPAESQHLYRQRRHYPECSSSGETLNSCSEGALRDGVEVSAV
jgi:hypothetical protein